MGNARPGRRALATGAKPLGAEGEGKMDFERLRMSEAWKAENLRVARGSDEGPVFALPGEPLPQPTRGEARPAAVQDTD